MYIECAAQRRRRASEAAEAAAARTHRECSDKICPDGPSSPPTPPWHYSLLQGQAQSRGQLELPVQQVPAGMDLRRYGMLGVSTGFSTVLLRPSLRSGSRRGAERMEIGLEHEQGIQPLTHPSCFLPKCTHVIHAHRGTMCNTCTQRHYVLHAHRGTMCNICTQRHYV